MNKIHEAVLTDPVLRAIEKHFFMWYAEFVEHRDFGSFRNATLALGKLLGALRVMEEVMSDEVCPDSLRNEIEMASDDIQSFAMNEGK